MNGGCKRFIFIPTHVENLSPLLFVLTEEVFSRGLSRLVMEGNTIPYKIPNGCTQVSHLMFADDVLIFTNGCKSSLDNLMSFIKDYENCSDQMLNATKSVFLTHKTTASRRAVIAKATNFSEGSFPTAYLGVALHYSKLTANMYDELIMKISKKVASWKGNLLSVGGKITLIRYVLSSIPVHILSVLNPPQSFLDRIEKIFSDFYWGNFEGKSKHHWIGWKRMAKPIEEGGIGVRDLNDVMKALQAKLSWRMLTMESLWTIYMFQKYFPNCDNWANPVIKKGHSTVWKNLASYFPSLVSNSGWVIKEGYISLWFENWGGSGCLQNDFPITRPGILLNQTCNNNEWNLPFLSTLGNQSFVGKFSKHELSFRHGMNIRYWPLNANGVFTAKDAFNFYRCRTPKWNMAKYIWNKHLPTKIAAFCWKLWHKGVKLDADIQRYGIALASKCSCCEHSVSDEVDHLFGDGDIASQVWFYFSQIFCFNFSNNRNWRAYITHWVAANNGKSQFHALACLVPFLILWEIWLSRVDYKYNEKCMSSEGIKVKVKKWLVDLNMDIKPKMEMVLFQDIALKALSINRKEVKEKRPIAVKWLTPPSGFLKLNVDGSYYEKENKAGGGGILRNYLGEIILAYSFELNANSVLESELKALYMGLQICYSLSLDYIHVESDSLTIVNWRNGISNVAMQHTNIWEDISELLNISVMRVSHIWREQNLAADALAKIGAMGFNASYLNEISLPSKVYGVYKMDQEGFCSFRRFRL